MRAAIYARFSTDLQNDRSIADQTALCRQYAARAGLEVVHCFEDRGISGSSVVNRPGWQRLMRAAENREFDIVVLEGIDRAFRDEADYHVARKRLDYLEITIHTVHGGAVSSLEGSMRAMMSAHYLITLRQQVRRAMTGLVREGKLPTGNSYGYAGVPGKPGERTIVDGEAEIVRRIFREFAGGASTRSIAHNLNADKIPSPRGGLWNASTLTGGQSRASGMLRNPLYAGRIVWNRTRKIKNPDTAKRVPRSNEKSEWVEQSVPELAIIDQDLFDLAQARYAKMQRRRGYTQRPKHLLSGLLRCAACGGGMASKGADKTGRLRIMCSTHRESRSCPDPHVHYIDKIEQLVLGVLRAELEHPALIAEYVREFHAEQKRLAHEGKVDRSRIERQLTGIHRDQERCINAIIKGIGDPEKLNVRSRELAAQQKRLEAELAALPAVETPVVVFLPSALAEYRRQLEHLKEALTNRPGVAISQAAEALRDIIEEVTVAPLAGQPGAVSVAIHGKLNSLLGYNAPDKAFTKGSPVGGTARSTPPAPASPKGQSARA